jgi:hypothetical protein
MAVLLIAAGDEGRPRATYRLQMLRLETDTAKSSGAAARVYHAAAPRPGRNMPVNSVPARQTLIVEQAPPELKLNQPIPLPVAISIALPAAMKQPERVRVADAPRPEIPLEIPPVAAEALPSVKLIALPEPEWVAQKTVIPKVNQSAIALPDVAPASSGDRADEATAQEASGGTVIAASGISAGPDDRKGARSAEHKVTRIDLPPDSRPRSSVLSESSEMPGRIVSTVYLRVGLRKNWILEYWGDGPRGTLEAPWPVTIFRPDSPLPADADAATIRGRLTADGQLEALELLVAGDWPEQEQFFEALRRWKFRPVMRDGKPAAVQVLLVAPRQPDE